MDGDPLAEPYLLSDPGRIWLVLQQGVPVAGQALAPALTVQPGSLTWRAQGTAGAARYAVRHRCLPGLFAFAWVDLGYRAELTAARPQARR